MTYTIYCDGSCRKNGTKGAIGAYAFAIVDKERVLRAQAGVEKDTTNQRMELLACIKGYEAVFDVLGASPSDDIIIYTDSAYLHNCYVQKWYERWLINGWMNSKREPVANKDLWIKILPIFNNARARLEKCKGHAGVKWNEYVDGLAQSASACYVEVSCSES